MNRLQLTASMVLLSSLFAVGAAPAQEVPGSERSSSAENQLFYVTLVVGDDQPATAAKLPASVQKALDDVRNYLPFDAYHVVDGALGRGAGRIKMLLRGPDGAHYSATLTYHDAPEAGRKSFFVDHFALTRTTDDLGGGKPLAPGVAPPAPEQPIATSFRIEPGQTLVVGSSSLSGSGTLIVLVTAVS